MPVLDPALPPTRAERLKRATHETHERLDQRIMAQRIFDSRERFAAFLRVQHRLHQQIDTLYAHAALQPLLPGLETRRRLPGITRDLTDLRAPLPTPVPPLPAALPVPAALGWLYVAEGAALGGAVIYKLAAPLGLDQAFGASHLAPPAGGIAAHWRSFTTALNAIVLPETDERQVEDGARAAFAAVGGFVTQEFP